MERETMSDCNVCLGQECEGYNDFERRQYPIARKEHICCECGEAIPKGAKYEYVALKYDGEFGDFKTCLICCELRTAFTCNDEPGYQVGICMGELWYEIRNELFPHMTTGCLQKIRTAEAKEFLVKRWNEWKFQQAAPR